MAPNRAVNGNGLPDMQKRRKFNEFQGPSNSKMGDEEPMSDASADDIQSHRPVTVKFESHYLKPVSEKVDMNYWPTMILHDCNVHELIEKRYQMVNVLNEMSQLKKVVVNGLLEVDPEDMGSLIKPLPDGARVNLEIPTFYSIDETPTIWIASKFGHFELDPSEQYQTIFLTMLRGIRLFFMAGEWYRNRKAAMSKPAMQKAVTQYPTAMAEVTALLLKYTLNFEGSGCSFDQVLEDCRRNKDFLIKHIQTTQAQDKSIQLLDTAFYKWLQEGCSNPRASQPRFKPTILRKASTIPSAKSGTTRSISTTTQPTKRKFSDMNSGVVSFKARKTTGSVSRNKSNTSSPQPQTPIPVPVTISASSTTPKTSSDLIEQFRPRKNASHKLEYFSPQRPLGTPEPSTMLEIMHAIICHAVYTSRDDKNLSNVTPKNISNWMYKDFSFKHPEACHEFVRVYAQQFIHMLPATWNTTPFYASWNGFHLQPSFLKGGEQLRNDAIVQFTDEQAGMPLQSMTYPIKRRGLASAKAEVPTQNTNNNAPSTSAYTPRPRERQVPTPTYPHQPAPRGKPPRSPPIMQRNSEPPEPAPLHLTPAQVHAKYLKDITSGPEHHEKEKPKEERPDSRGVMPKKPIRRFDI